MRNPDFRTVALFVGQSLAWEIFLRRDLPEFRSASAPSPGNFVRREYGTFGARQLGSWGQVFLDANVQKSFRLTESKQLSIRMDSTNIMNHHQIATPNFMVGGTAFGQIASKGNAIFGGGPVQRTFQGQLRLTF
jgi:hypothetical protein